MLGGSVGFADPNLAPFAMSRLCMVVNYSHCSRLRRLLPWCMFGTMSALSRSHGGYDMITLKNEPEAALWSRVYAAALAAPKESSGIPCATEADKAVKEFRKRLQSDACDTYANGAL